MRCPQCGHQEDRVLDSRAARDGAAIRRRRLCLSCEARFTTYEEILKDTLRVTKRDGRIEDFSRQKLLRGIERACEKRPVSMSTMEKIVDGIIERIERKYERAVPSEAIGDQVMEALAKYC